MYLDLNLYISRSLEKILYVCIFRLLWWVPLNLWVSSSMHVVSDIGTGVMEVPCNVLVQYTHCNLRV